MIGRLSAPARSWAGLLLVGPLVASAQTTNLEELQKKLDDARKAQQQKKLEDARKAQEQKKAAERAASSRASPASSAASGPLVAPASTPSTATAAPSTATAASTPSASATAPASAAAPSRAAEPAASVPSLPARIPSNAPLAASDPPSGTPAKMGRAEAFVQHAEGVLRNTVTGLLWTQTDNGRDITWSSAQEHCARTSGWRLPSADELQSLYDGRLPLLKCGATACRASEQFRLTGPYFWSSELDTKTALFRATSVSLVDGRRYSFSVGHSIPDRVLCVRQP